MLITNRLFLNTNNSSDYAKTGAIANRQCTNTQLVTRQTNRSAAVRQPLLSLYLAVLRWHLKLFSEFGDLKSKSSFSRKKTFLISLKKKMFSEKMPLKY